MKNRILLWIVSLFTVFCLEAKTIENPAYEWRNTNVVTFTKIERLPESTRFHVHSVYKPKWWIQIDSAANMIDPVSGTAYAPVGAEGISIGEKLWMPESGQHDFVLIYPPIPKTVKTLDFNDGSWKICGLRIDGKKVKKPVSIDAGEWMKKNDAAYPGQPEKFFKSGKCHVYGVINGYNRRAESNLTLYVNDPVVGNSKVTTINVNDDGTFDAVMDVPAPGIMSLTTQPDFFTSVYLEPDRDLAIYLNWDDMIDFDGDSKLKNICFGGQLGRVNRDIIKAPSMPFFMTPDIAKSVAPEKAIEKVDSVFEKYRATLEKYISENVTEPLAKKLLEANMQSHFATELLDYEMYRSFFGDNDTTGKKVMPMELYMPLKKIMDENDEWFLANSGMHVLVNRMAFSGMFSTMGYKDKKVNVTIPSYNGMRFLKEKGLAMAAEDEKFLIWLDMNLGKEVAMTDDEYEDYKKKGDAMMKKAEDNNLKDELLAKYAASPAPRSDSSADIIQRGQKYDFVNNFWGYRNSPLLLQLCSSTNITNFGHMNFKEHSRESIDRITGSARIITNDFIGENLKKYLESGLAAKNGYLLPDDERGRIVKNLIKPHEGKILVLDLWGIYCGPCRANIVSSKKMREDNRNHPDFKYLFITGKEDSAGKAYDDFVAENLEGEECHMLPQADFNRLRDLFNFSGIPHYVMIGRDGRVLNDNYDVRNLRKDLEEYGITVK